MQGREFEMIPPKVKHKGAKNQSNVFNFKEFTDKRTVRLVAKSEAQEEYIDLLLNPNKLIVLATGPAGCGKTMLAVLAAIKAYKEGKCSKIIITRPAVGVDDESHGYLPGTLNEKMAPWTRPIFDVFAEHYSAKEILVMLEDEIIEISPLAFMRGRTFKNCWIIADEMQNTSVNQLKMLLTRLGEDSKMVVTGDLDQVDRKFKTDSGMTDFISRVSKYEGSSISTISMSNNDVQRHFVVTEILEMYE